MRHDVLFRKTNENHEKLKIQKNKRTQKNVKIMHVTKIKKSASQRVTKEMKIAGNSKCKNKIKME